MKVYKYSELSEANLSTKELSKIGKDGSYRGDVLVRKINNDEPLSTSNDGEITVSNKEELISNITDDEGNYNPDSANSFFTSGRFYKKVIKSDSDSFKLNDIEKTVDFGSSGGSSLGSVATKDVESLQCLILSFRQQKGRHIQMADYDELLKTSMLGLNKYMQYIGVDTDISKDMIRNYKVDWGLTFLKTSNALFMRKVRTSKYTKEEVLLRPDIRYKFYQVSCKRGISDSIQKCFSKLKLKIPIAKWNPSDIWAVDTQSENDIKNQLKNCDSISDLNDIIDVCFEQRKLIGISLKMVKKKEKIKLIINKMTESPKYRFTGVKLAKDPFSTASLRISAERTSREFGNITEYMTIRSFDGSNVQNVSGEVSGKAARQGKVSLTRINQILLRHIGYVVPTVMEISNWTDEELSIEIQAINDKITNRYGEILRGGRIYESNRARLTSKYQALFLCWIFLDNEKKKKTNGSTLTVVDQVIEEMFHYALSIRFGTSKLSRTPKYVRVID